MMKPLMVICGVAAFAVSAASSADPPKPAAPVAVPRPEVRPAVRDLLTTSPAYQKPAEQPQVHCDKVGPGCEQTGPTVDSAVDGGSGYRSLSHDRGPLQARRAQMITDGRALVAQAEKVTAAYQPTEGGPSKAELDGSIGQVKSDLDTMSEMGETESLRLQMAMDRMSKMMETLSNVLKKISDTQKAIVQNIR